MGQGAVLPATGRLLYSEGLLIVFVEIRLARRVH
jgi:hypothetical protein